MFAPFPPARLSELRQAGSRLFGLRIQAARQEAGLSLEQAARLAGIEVSEWMAVEDGHVPQTVNRLRAMAAVLEISFDRMASMVRLCREPCEL